MWRSVVYLLKNPILQLHKRLLQSHAFLTHQRRKLGLTYYYRQKLKQQACQELVQAPFEMETNAITQKKIYLKFII